jgi:flagellar hook assembly protein FlgD
LDVTFDGSYIMNGDIVSSKPTIVIRLKDDNSFILKNDTIGMEIKLKKCEGCEYERVNFNGPQVTYSVASSSSDFEITYNPDQLTDGTYSMSVQGRDESGNNAGTAPYEISFEVVTESSITHFYPYPNPFSTQTRFVFTLTGSEIPEKIKIQIMTISGRIVREINQDEIGPIKIGHNITQFAWDGTDEFGDQLANGVYFYRVVMRSNDPMEHRTTMADGAFKDGFGKLYILR